MPQEHRTELANRAVELSSILRAGYPLYSCLFFYIDDP